MIPQALDRRIDRLIKELIEDGGVATASLASILVAAQGAVQGGYDIALCRLVWSAAHSSQETFDQPDRLGTSLSDIPLLNQPCQAG